MTVVGTTTRGGRGPARTVRPGAESGTFPVSVVIPVYNRPAMIRRALESVAAQRPRAAAELIVVDDASCDDTAAVAERMGARVLRHERNLGEGSARNTGVEAATQPWIALLDSDDEWLPHHLDALWRLRSDHVLVAASALGCAEDPAEDRFSGAVTRRAVVLRSPAALLYPHNFVGQSAVMIRRRALLEAGGYRRDLPRAADLDLLVRVLERGTGIVSPRVGALYHEHGGQVSRQRLEMRVAHHGVAAAYARRPWASSPLLDRMRGALLWDEFRAAWRDGRRKNALLHFGRLASRPQRVVGLMGLLGWRLLARTRTSEARRVRPPSGGAGRHRMLGELIRMPVVDAAVETLLVRGLGIETVSTDDDPRNEWR